MKVPSCFPRLLTALLAAVVAAACATVFAPPVPPGQNWGLQTIIKPRGSFTSVNQPKTGVAGYFMFDQSGAGGSSTATFNEKSSEYGTWWAGDRRYNARWHIAETNGPCKGRGYIETTMFYGLVLALHCRPSSGIGAGYGVGSYDYLDAIDGSLEEFDDITADLPPIPDEGDDGTLRGSLSQTLYPDDEIWSANEEFRLIYQQDGNLVIYQGETPIWGSDTLGTPGRAVMQSDGNFVIYDDNDDPVWASGTDGENGAYLALLNDGSLVIISSDGAALWWNGSSTWIS